MNWIKIPIYTVVDKLTDIVSKKYSRCSDDTLEAVLALSCVSFHFGWKHKAYPHGFKWKDKSYPRSLFADIKTIRRLARNDVVFRKGRVIAGMFLPISDPAGIAFDSCHEPLLASVLPASESTLFDERYLWHSWPFFSISLFAGYLKRSGDLVSAENLYRKLIETELSPFEGYMGLADIAHLLANWRLEIKEYKDAGVYPARPLAPQWKFNDKVWDLESFRLDQAIKLYELAHAIRPGDAFALSHLGRAYLDAGDLEQASAALSAAAKQRPRNAFIRIRSGYARVLAGKRGAMPALRKALAGRGALYGQFGGIRRAVLRDPADVAQRSGKDCIGLLSEEIHTGSYMIAVEREISCRSFSIRLPEPLTFELENAREIGLGGKLVDEKTLIANSKHLGIRQLRMFSDCVLAHNDKIAVLGIAQETRFHRSARTVLLPPGAVFNYFHFMFETLGSLLLLERHFDLSKFDLVLSGEPKAYQKRLFEIALKAPPRVRIRNEAPFQHFLFRQARYMPFPSRWSVPHPKVVRLVRERVSRHLASATKGKRVYLSRESVKSGRKTLNEKAIGSMLQARGFITKDSGLMSIDEQTEFFKDVEVLVAPAGAALTNLIFCPSSVIVVALTTAFHHSEVFTMIASALDQKMIVCAGPSQTIPNPFFFWSTLDLEVDLSNLTAAVDWAIGKIPSSSPGE
jgi:tetratricopeptide (TPR) repeat protein